MQNKWQVSASSIGCFKACAFRYWLKYIKRIRRIRDTDALRVGTNWHKLLELLPDMDAVVAELDQAYAVCPDFKEMEDWLVEKYTLLYSMAGYNWYYGDTDYEVVATELGFEIPLRNPENGRALPDVVVKGKIDKILRDGTLLIGEHKSTSKSVDPDSTFWQHLRLDTQVSMYVYAARQVGYDVSGCLYDAWHKPAIAPKKLTQGDSKKFVEDGLYFDEVFKIGYEEDGKVFVNEHPAITEPGKKEGTFAIRETPQMYGARLLHDISERPEFYFARKFITRTEQDMERFERELYSIYKTSRFMDKFNCFYHDESACESKYHCEYMPICYNNVNVEEGIPPEFECKLKEQKNDSTTKKENAKSTGDQETAESTT